MNSGRFYNIFHYDRANGNQNQFDGGQWEEAVASAECANGVKADNNVTNGEILIIPAVRTADRQATWIALQSVPLGPGRTNVAIYYKELCCSASYETAKAFATGWSQPYLITSHPSAYSTMAVQKDGRVAFFWEDTDNGQGGYELLYRPLCLEQITGGKYVINKAKIKK